MVNKMAVLSRKELSTGVVLNYHKIHSIVISYETGNCTCKMASYLDEETRRNGKNPVEVVDIAVRFQNDSIPENIRKAFYDLICTVPEPLDMTKPPSLTQSLYWMYPENTAC